MMRVLLFGKTGQVGYQIARNAPSNWIFTGLNRNELDLVDTNKIRNTIRKISPQIIINAAAYTKVEDAELSQELALQINAKAVQVIAEEANRIKATLIHYSTDYVFDGSKRSPYLETDTPNPINFYGFSKLKGDDAIINTGGSFIILRTSWVYSTRGENFLTKIMKLSRKNDIMQVVDDQIGCPTWSRDIANTTIELIDSANDRAYDYFRSKKGVYNFCSKGSVSRYFWAKAILKSNLDGTNRKIIPIATESAASNAMRPKNSVLSCKLFEDTFRIKTPNWKSSLMKSMAIKETEFFNN